jgi:hypothetical protein
VTGNILNGECGAVPTQTGNVLNNACPPALSILGNVAPGCSCNPSPVIDLESELGVTYAPTLFATGFINSAVNVPGDYLVGDSVVLKVVPFVTRNGVNFYGPPLTSAAQAIASEFESAIDWEWGTFDGGPDPDGVRVLRNVNGAGFLEYRDLAYQTAFLDTGSGWTAGSTITPLANGQSPQWDDQSGNALNAVQASTAAMPLRVPAQLNGHPALRFDTNDSLTTASFPAPLQTTLKFTIHAVIKLSQTTNNLAIFSTSTGAGPQAYTQGGVIKMYGSSVFVSTYAPTTNAVIMQFVFSDTLATLYVNGVQYGTGALTFAVFERLFLNSDSSALLSPIGYDLFQFKGFRSALTAAQLAALRTASQTKYAL